MAFPTVGSVFGVFRNFVQNIVLHFVRSKLRNDPERMSGSIITYLFNSNYNIEPSTKITGHFKNLCFFC